MRSGDRRLSEIASHLVIPEGVVSTAWPMVARQLERMDTPLDTWQQGLLTVLLGKRASGLYACGVGGAVVSIPRQVGKTYTFGALAFALCLAAPDTLILWTAHRARTHNETFKSMCAMAERDSIKPFVKRYLTGAGTEAVEFASCLVRVRTASVAVSPRLTFWCSMRRRFCLRRPWRTWFPRLTRHLMAWC